MLWVGLQTVVFYLSVLCLCMHLSIFSPHPLDTCMNSHIARGENRYLGSQRHTRELPE